MKMKIFGFGLKSSFFVLTVIIQGAFSGFLSAQHTKTTSVLANHKAHKLSIAESGIYKIDKSFIDQHGISSSNAQNLSVYGGWGHALPQKNADERPNGLEEYPIQSVGLEDGSFDAGDYILFYAQGAHRNILSSDRTRYGYEYNVYSDENYVYLVEDSKPAAKVSSAATSRSTPELTITSYDFLINHKVDERRGIVSGGRNWYGEQWVKGTSLPFRYAVAGADPSRQAFVKMSSLATNVAEDNQASIVINGLKVNTNIQRKLINDIYSVKGYDISGEQFFNFSSNTFDISVNGKSGSGFLDFFMLMIPRSLSLYSNQTSFRALAATAVSHSRYKIVAPAGATVWDVTDPMNISAPALSHDGTHLMFDEIAGADLHEYMVFNGSSFSNPGYVAAITQQNYHGITSAELIIVTPEIFKSEAERLAQHRREFSGLEVSVVELDKIYNEFSSGKSDVTSIRDFVKMVYDRSSSRLKYVLLFGDGHFDHKGILYKEGNFMPTYQSYSSSDPINSYASDDYFGFMDAEEGEWTEQRTNCYSGKIDSYCHYVDLGVGRLPVKSLEEAQNVVNKLIHYDVQKSALGKWRKKVVLFADDGDANDHQIQANEFAHSLDTVAPDYDNSRVLLDAFPMIITPTKMSSPRARDEFDRYINDGSLILNFNGHGSPDALTEEGMFTRTQIGGWDNLDNMPLLVTATCQFGRYDDPLVVSAAEEAILHKQGGAIALFTTTRPVYTNSNKIINEAFYRAAFKKVNGSMPRLGDIYQATKIQSVKDFRASDGGLGNRCFALLGDPSMTLAYPKQEMKITEINGKAFDGSTPDTLQALQRVNMKGMVVDAQGNKVSGFNGITNVTVFDKMGTYITLGNKSADDKMTYQNRQNFLFNGKATVRDGEFSIDFVMPKDINGLDSGKITMYGAHESENSDAGGHTYKVMVGGSVDNAPEDNSNPTMSLFMNDSSFISGGIVGESAELLVYLHDESGINIANNSLGHDLIAVLDDNDSEPYLLNDRYESFLDDFTTGGATLKISGLEPGRHSFKVKGWDTYNNSVTKEIVFYVSNSSALETNSLLVYPNPVRTNTTFRFSHNRPNDRLHMDVVIVDMSGRVSAELSAVKDEAESVIELEWDRTGTNGSRLNNGFYFYRLKVKSELDGSEVTESGKLVLLD